MAHFAFVSPPFTGHLDPMLALAAALRSHGHRTTMFGIGDVSSAAARTACDAVPLGLRTHPRGTLSRLSRHLAAPGGLGFFRVLGDMVSMTGMLADELPAACRSGCVDAIVSDQLEPAGILVAAHLGLPVVTVANALPIDRDPALPPPFTDWPFDDSPRGLTRNRGGYRVADLLMRPVTAGIARAAGRLGVAAPGGLERCGSPFAELTQLVPALDFPRRDPGPLVHTCGPLRSSRDADADVSDLIGDGRPLVYASLGTLQGGRTELFRQIAQVCAARDLHLVIAHGGRMAAAEAAALPGRPVVRAFVPQRSLLRHADLLVTNGGLNTVLDAAVAGVPMLVIPIAFEQGAIGARVRHAGVGDMLPRSRMRQLGLAVDRVRTDPAVRERARGLAAHMRACGGVSEAVAVIEEVMRTGRPVLSRASTAALCA